MFEVHFHKQQHKFQAVQALYVDNANDTALDHTLDQIVIHTFKKKR